MKDPVAPLSTNADVRNACPESVVQSSMSRSRELSEGEEDPAMVKCWGRRLRSHRGRGNKRSGGSECTGGGSGTTTIGGAVVSISLSTASTEN